MRHLIITAFLQVAACLIVMAILIGCGEEEETIEKPVTVGSLKHTEETVPAAPQAPGLGNPFVKEVGYYKDWKLTKPLSGTVTSGTTFWIKVVFSEPVGFKPADDNTARPILYYRTGKTLIRFRIAKHGAGGEDFVSGDAKPWHSGTNDYICKYTVPKEATGKFVISVGKLNTDTDGNTLAAFYTHNEKLQIGEPITPPKNEEPMESEQPKDTMSPTVLSVTHYLDKRRSQEVDTSDSVPDGTDVYTVVRFSEPVTPVITYTTGNSSDERYTLSQQRHGVHWRGVCKPIDANGTSFLCYATAQEDAFSVTVTTETADLAGNRLAEATTAPTLQVMRSVVVTDPTPVVVPDPIPLGLEPEPPMTEGPMKYLRRPTVRLVYFRPTDTPVRQDSALTLHRLITNAREHYANEMQRLGFSRKTFLIETGDNGLPMVYHIEGQFNERHYRADPENGQPRGVYKAKDEVLENHPNGHHHIYLFAMDLSQNAFGAPGCAFGGLHYADRQRTEALGGYVIIPASGDCSESLGIVMHELGHAFGLHHDFRQGRHTDRIMAYGSQNRLSTEAADWLSVSVYFNDTPAENAHGVITLVEGPKRVQDGIKVIFDVADIDGLHLTQLLRHEATSYILIDFKKVKGTTDRVEFVSPKLARPFTDKNSLQMIDKAGSITRKRIPPVD